MPQSPSFLRSAGGGHIRSPGGAKMRSIPTPNGAFVVVGFVPIWGIGPIATTPTGGWPLNPGAGHGGGAPYLWDQMTFSDVWPGVYQTITETWNDGAGRTQTTTTQWLGYVDVWYTVSTTGSATAAGTYGSFTVSPDGLTITATYTWSGYTGTYTGVISNKFSRTWEDCTDQANALLDKVALPAFPFINYPYVPYSWGVYPTQAAPGYSTYGGLNGFLTAAMRGMQFRCPTFDPATYAMNMKTIVSLWTAYNFGIGVNSGGCMSAKSLWWIGGTDIGVSSPTFGPRYTANQLSLYGQAYLGVNSMGPVATIPSPFTLLSTGYKYTNPFPIPGLLSFGPGDVITLLNTASGGGAGSAGMGAGDAGASGVGAGGTTARYGILDFNNTLI